VRSGWVDPEQLLAHPLNYRIHPQFQQDAILANLDEIGQYKPIQLQDGTDVVIDGHARVRIALREGKRLWADWTDLTDAEVLIALATGDPISALAEFDRQKYAELLHDTTSTEAATMALLSRIAEEHQIIPADDPLTDPLTDPDDGDAESAGEDEGPSDGSLLALVDVTLADPSHEVERGDVWHLGPHTLICWPVVDGWDRWAHRLHDDMLLAVHPGPFIPLSRKAEAQPVLMVQPDPYIAGHILDRWAEVKGEATLSRESDE